QMCPVLGMGVDRERRRRSEKDVAIRRGRRDVLCADDAAGAAAVLYYDRLADLFAHLLPDRPGDGVGDTAGRKCDHEVDGPIGKRLWPGARGSECDADCEQPASGHMSALLIWVGVAGKRVTNIF